MTESNIGKTVRIHYPGFKYEGILKKEDDIIYSIFDFKEKNLVQIPKRNSILIVLSQSSHDGEKDG